MSEFTTRDDNILLMLGEMRADLRAILVSNEIARLDRRDLTKRVSALEKGRATIIGAAAVIGSLASFVVPPIVKNFFHT